MNKIKTLLTKLVEFPSITPNDADCQEFMIAFLEGLGFQCQRFNNPPVSNFFARLGQGSPLLVFAGHTDVVPVGEVDKWRTDPFIVEEIDGLLYGRGTADMKGSLASMMLMATRFVENLSHFTGSLGFLITSGEEGDEFALGTPYVMSELHKQGVKPDFCVIGEPSSSQLLGDVIRIGRRGSLTGKLILHGKQGHVAYPHLAQNPIHNISPVLAELTSRTWDTGNQYFPPTSLQITHIKAGGHGGNIIPGELTLHFNFRFSTEQSADTLKAAVESCFKNHGLLPTIEWTLNGEPFLTAQGKLLESCIRAIQQVTNRTPELSTGGGTSDGRFIAPYGVEVIELGPLNGTIHQVNECVSLNDLGVLSSIYYSICEQLLH
ncbi:succinyl-diaminopimelate desuccinylase [Legionella lansingensis]|uniref:Succinyl-diaminopimelate desuccinylase n=1 Tax=Legionella lansingensis TaxID=45067 RepID=A0A0W0W0I7_9GAMM|nr:succinyl-diaminopimelate desuccinylase [Legionella lansingensis]KTD25730.1 succinyl-diaminopimelate desuccinylase [Legionella lansingensis]SNV49286.1 succinyl-diaminopimelate desuccinylase [Legionella lansingensis]